MLKSGSLQEKILVGRLKLKDKEAFSHLYDFYLDKIYRFIYFKVTSVSEAEDLTSQTFLKIWQLALEGKIKVNESFQSLLYKVARNLVIDYYRSSNREKNKISLEEATHIAEADAHLDQAADVKIEMEIIGRRLKKLKSEGFLIIALENNRSRHIDISKFRYNPKKPLVLILGNEVSGIPPRILKQCDKVLEIPMKGKKESLNVAVAFGVAAYALPKNRP